MTKTEAREYISTITYKPNWSIQTYDGNFNFLRLRVDAKLLDSLDPEKLTTVTLETFIDIKHLDTKDLIMQNVLSVIERIEGHEIMEWFKVNGVCVTDPHPKEPKVSTVGVLK